MSESQPKLLPCSRRGLCCTGEGKTWLIEADIVRICGHLGLNRLDFLLEYCLYTREGYILKSTGIKSDCIFLTPAGCIIHSVKPLQCLRWPLWRELYENPQVFTESKKTCAMLSEISHEDFCRIYRTSPDEKEPLLKKT